MKNRTGNEMKHLNLLNNKVFMSLANTANGDVNGATRFNIGIATCVVFAIAGVTTIAVAIERTRD